METLEGSVNLPQGFKASGGHVGLKKRRKDFALIYSDQPAVMAGVFTTNFVKAACVLRNQQILAAAGPVRGIVINSGHANACTGEQGLRDNEAMAAAAAAAWGVRPMEVLTASTGVIGVPLPMDTIRAAITRLTPELSSELGAGLDAAEGILTTDSVIKRSAVQIKLGGRNVIIAGIAKGSGMIHPNMATMLSFITTDVCIDPNLLQRILEGVAQETYNMISVDGDTSTNDMALVLANGLALNPLLKTDDSDDVRRFREAFAVVNRHLAQAVVRDGEGASKFMEVTVRGAAAKEDARRLVKSVLNSSLVKTALFGEDANWGRILCALGYAGVSFNPDTVRLAIAAGGRQLELFTQGLPCPFSEAAALEILQHKDIQICLQLQEGSAEAVGWGCDLSYEYVKINGEYRS